MLLPFLFDVSLIQNVYQPSPLLLPLYRFPVEQVHKLESYCENFIGLKGSHLVNQSFVVGRKQEKGYTSMDNIVELTDSSTGLTFTYQLSPPLSVYN